MRTIIAARPHLYVLVPFLAAWAVLAGGGGCTPEDPSQAASPTTYTYTIPNWLDAQGVLWQKTYVLGDYGIRIQGGDSFVYSGGIDGPIPNNAVYECYRSDNDDGCSAGTSIHCPGGSEGVCATCPSTCFEFHTAEGIAHDTSDLEPASYRDMCIRDEGDGVSAEDDPAGPIEVLRSRFVNIHDDAVEHDWGQDISINDSLFDGVFQAIAVKARQGEEAEQPTIRLTNSFVRLHRFLYAYKNKPGHGGVFKLDDSNLPTAFILHDNLFFIGPEVGNGQHILPPPALTNSTDCSNNVIYFSGSTAQKNAWLADEDGADGLTNAQKLSALSYCYTVVYKEDSQTFGDFLWLNWLGNVTDWLGSHQAATGC